MVRTVIALLVGAALPDDLWIAKDGQTVYRIVIPEAADPAVEHGAEELARCLREMTGATLPIVSDTAPADAHEIVVGVGRRTEALGIDFGEIGTDGYRLKTLDQRLILAGPSSRGTLYAVVGWLTDHLGARWFAPGLERLPRLESLALPQLDERVTPVFEYREPYLFEAFDADWQPRMRIHGKGFALGPERGGRLRFGEGFFVHTFEHLVPTAQHFESHPDYFSLVNGERRREHPQLCCTNEDVIRICTQGILSAIAAEPDATVFSVSQNDWANDCECEPCQELVTREDSRMAPVLHLVNRVAEVVAKQHPGKLIETLAYQWSRRPPKTMRPLPNVVVRLCTIECSFGEPLATSANPANASFREDLVAWSKISDRLWIWNYNTSFMHFLLPFPNHHLRAANLRFFAEHGVRGVFEQDCYNTLGSEMAPLDAYVASRLLWDPWLEPDALQAELLDGWFGAAATPITSYLKQLATQAGRHHVGIWSGPDAPYLDDEFLIAADRHWAQAEERVAEDSSLTRRVQTARLSVDYAILERGRSGAGFAFERDHERSRLTPHPLPSARLEPFLQALKRSGLERLNEWNALDFDAYARELRELYRARHLTPRPARRESPPPSAAPHDGALPAEEAGLALDCFLTDEIQKSLPDVATKTPLWTRGAPTIDLSQQPREDGFVFRFRGELCAPRSGIYRFALRCNDGARLRIGSADVVDYGGIHPTSERIGFVALEAGWHPIEVLYVENRGSQALGMTWEGPGIARGPIPPSALKRR